MPAPEYLERGPGGPPPGQWPPPPAPSGSGGGRRAALITGGLVGAVALVGGGVWAATSFFGTGAQPAEALPDTTLGYASIDLDPSGGQKIEALKTLRKFPAFKDQVGLDTDDDLRERLFDEIQGSAGCEDLDFADDIEPWLGDRFAVAAVDTGADSPTPVVVVQVKDAGAAEDGMSALRDCAGAAGGSGDETGGWAIEGDWAVIAESDDIAQDVVDAAGTSSLAADDDFQKWTGEAGDTGIATLYAAPGAGELLADAATSSGGLVPGAGELGDLGATTPEVPQEGLDALKDFQGMAVTVRFDSGALEIEAAGDSGVSGAATSALSDRGGEVVASLPDDTVAAVGLAFADGWGGDVLDSLSSYSGGELDIDELLAQVERETDLSLPDDAETLLGDSAALSLGGDFDPEQAMESSDGSGIPVAMKVEGDADGIESVLEKLRSLTGGESDVLGSDSDGDMVAIGPDADYRAQVLEDGDLGDSEVFKDVVREADSANAVLFVNFDAGDGWLSGLAEGNDEVQENLEPLSALGISAWQDDDVSHAVLRITTD